MTKIPAKNVAVLSTGARIVSLAHLTPEQIVAAIEDQFEIEQDDE